MPKTWSEVEQSQEYQALTAQNKANAKKQYFDNVVAKKPEFNSLDNDSQIEAKKQFFGGRLKEDIPESEFTPKNIAKETAKGSIDTVGDWAKRRITGLGQVIQHPGISLAKNVAGNLYGLAHPIDTARIIGKSISQDPSKFITDTALDTASLMGAGGLLGKAAEMAPGMARGLEESAAKSYTKALGPTTKDERDLASEVVPGLIERKKVFSTRGGLLDKAQQEAEKSGERLEVGYLTLPKKSRIEAGAVVKSIRDKQKALKVNGILPDVNFQKFNQLERVKKDFINLTKDKSVSPQTVRKIRQFYDDAIEGSKQGFKMTGRGGPRIDAQRILTSSIRREIAKKFPSISVLNKEFSFWQSLSDLLETTAPKSPSVFSAFHGFFAKHAGAVNPYVGLIVNLNKLFSDNVLFQSLSGATKSHLAALISKGKIGQASGLISSYLSRAGEKTSEAIEGTGKKLKNLGERGSTGAVPKKFKIVYSPNTFSKSHLDSLPEDIFYKGEIYRGEPSSDVENYAPHEVSWTTSKKVANSFRSGGGKLRKENVSLKLKNIGNSSYIPDFLKDKLIKQGYDGVIFDITEELGGASKLDPEKYSDNDWGEYGTEISLFENSPLSKVYKESSQHVSSNSNLSTPKLGEDSDIRFWEPLNNELNKVGKKLKDKRGSTGAVPEDEKLKKLYHATDSDKINISTNEDRLIPNSVSLSKNKYTEFGKNIIETSLSKDAKILKISKDKFYKFGKETDTPKNRGKAIYEYAKKNGYDAIYLDKNISGYDEYAVINKDKIIQDSQSRENSLKKSLDQVGVKFKEYLPPDHPNNLYKELGQNEGILYFDVLDKNGGAHTMSIKASQATPENILNKIKSQDKGLYEFITKKK